MSKLPALVSALAKCDGRPRQTLDHIARVIREAGYIATTKRGSGAAEMTGRDAANLILGINGADIPREAPIAIDRFRSLTLEYAWAFPDLVRPLDTFKQISSSKNFGEALERLIDGMPDTIGAAFDFFDQGTEKNEVKQAWKKCMLRSAWHRPALFPFSLSITLCPSAVDIVCELYLSHLGDVAPSSERSVGDPDDVAPSSELSVSDPSDVKPSSELSLGDPDDVAPWKKIFVARFMADPARVLTSAGRGQTDRSVSVTISGYTLFVLWRTVAAEIPSFITEAMGDAPETEQAVA